MHTQAQIETAIEDGRRICEAGERAPEFDLTRDG
jgi:hypothetical protein